MPAPTRSGTSWERETRPRRVQFARPDAPRVVTGPCVARSPGVSMRPTPLRARSWARPHIALVARVLRALFACAALASFGTPAHADAPRPTTAAVESDAPLKIDGALDEAAWRSAPEIAAFQL